MMSQLNEIVWLLCKIQLGTFRQMRLCELPAVGNLKGQNGVLINGQDVIKCVIEQGKSCFWNK